MQAEDERRVKQALWRTADDLASASSAEKDGSFERRLDQLTRAALVNVPGADMVGLTLRMPAGGLMSYGQTDPVVSALDRLQVELGEGPSVETLAEGGSGLTVVRDFADDDRWPRFCPEVVGHGLRSLVSAVMAPRAAGPGAVNVYSRGAGAFDRVAETIAAAFAMQAGIVIYGAQQISDLERAVQSRDAIGQAKGVLMERHRVSAERAFEMLVRASQDTHIKLVDVARWVVGEVERPDTPSVIRHRRARGGPSNLGSAGH